jgi:GR25 family glycosyltransferase involved in LPS biosynthesis
METFVINLDRRPDRWKIVQPQINKFTNNYQRFSAIDTNNTIGCAQSYFKLLEENNHFEYIMIFQDDIILFDKSREIWDKYIKEVPDDWDIILSGVHFAHKCKSITPNVIKLGDFSGLQMIQIKTSILPIIKEWNEKGGFDRFLGKLSMENKLNIYCILPFCSIQSNGFSDLRHKNTLDHNLFKKYEYYLYNHNKTNPYESLF